jgi:hypothetical protein
MGELLHALTPGVKGGSTHPNELYDDRLHPAP